MRPDARVLQADVDRAASDITRFTEGMDRETYVGDARTQAAVERKFEIIGEALNRLHRTHPEVAAYCGSGLPCLEIGIHEGGRPLAVRNVIQRSRFSPRRAILPA